MQDNWTAMTLGGDGLLDVAWRGRGLNRPGPSPPIPPPQHPGHRRGHNGISQQPRTPPDRAWLVQLRRGDRHVVIAIGLRRPAANRLAEQVNELLREPDL
jgi:hypothetical protein